MLSYKTVVLALACSVFAAPIRREVPQEHSHEPILTAVRTSLNLNNPDKIQDPVFALLGNAAAAGGAGDITDTDCLQQAVADQAFTNAKAAGDTDGMVNALIFRALERNSGKVGATTAACTSIKATNPEIAAIQQHQDPASDNAASVNKAITLELAKQIASIGGDPQLALKSGTFAPGDVNDPTAKGNSCDDANDPNGCIFTQNLLVDDATADEINAAVAGVSASGSSNSTATATASATDSADAGASTTAASSDTATSCAAAATVTVTPTAASDSATATAASDSATATATSSATAAASGGNLQTFTGSLGGISPPAVNPGGRGFVVSGSDDFLNVAAALGRSCDIQHNKCADAANSGGGFSVGDCDSQNTQCRAAASA